MAVGSTVVVDFTKAWRIDIDWAIATDDGVPPLYNELQVQEKASAGRGRLRGLGHDLDRPDRLRQGWPQNLDWCGSTPVGTLTPGTVSYAVQWLLPVLDSEAR